MKILAIDPGGTTGAVVLQAPSSGEVLWFDQIPFDDVAERLDHLLRVEYTIDLIVIERFFITPRTVQYTRQPEALYVIGGVLFLAKLEGIPVRMQAAADAKNAWPNDRLKGWPIKGPHAKDALRHGLLALSALGVYVPTQT